MPQDPLLDGVAPIPSGSGGDPLLEGVAPIKSARPSFLRDPIGHVKARLAKPAATPTYSVPGTDYKATKDASGTIQVVSPTRGTYRGTQEQLRDTLPVAEYLHTREPHYQIQHLGGGKVSLTLSRGRTWQGTPDEVLGGYQSSLQGTHKGAMEYLDRKYGKDHNYAKVRGKIAGDLWGIARTPKHKVGEQIGFISQEEAEKMAQEQVIHAKPGEAPLYFPTSGPIFAEKGSPETESQGFTLEAAEIAAKKHGLSYGAHAPTNAPSKQAQFEAKQDKERQEGMRQFESFGLADVPIAGHIAGLLNPAAQGSFFLNLATQPREVAEGLVGSINHIWGWDIDGKPVSPVDRVDGLIDLTVTGLAAQHGLGKAAGMPEGYKYRPSELPTFKALKDKLVAVVGKANRGEPLTSADHSVISEAVKDGVPEKAIEAALEPAKARTPEDIKAEIEAEKARIQKERGAKTSAKTKEEPGSGKPVKSPAKSSAGDRAVKAYQDDKSITEQLLSGVKPLVEGKAGEPAPGPGEKTPKSVIDEHAPKAQEPPKKGEPKAGDQRGGKTFVGLNPDGDYLWEDEKGVRHKQKPMGSVLIKEKAARGKAVAERQPAFLTVSDLVEKNHGPEDEAMKTKYGAEPVDVPRETSPEEAAPTPDESPDPVIREHHVPDTRTATDPDTSVMRQGKPDRNGFFPNMRAFISEKATEAYESWVKGGMEGREPVTIDVPGDGEFKLDPTSLPDFHKRVTGKPIQFEGPDGIVRQAIDHPWNSGLTPMAKSRAWTEVDAETAAAYQKPAYIEPKVPRTSATALAEAKAIKITPKVGLGIDPEDWVKIAKKAALYVEYGYRSFVEAMQAHYPFLTDDHLKELWKEAGGKDNAIEEIEKPEGPVGEHLGTGDEVRPDGDNRNVETKEPKEGDQTGGGNQLPSQAKPKAEATGLAAQVQAKEVTAGKFAEPAKGARVSKTVSQKHGKAVLDDIRKQGGDPIAHAENMAGQIAAAERPFSWKEEGILLEGKRLLLKEAATADQAMWKAKGTPLENYARVQSQQAQFRLQSYIDNVKKGSTEWHNTGMAMQEGVNVDTGKYEDVITAAQREGPVTAKQRQEYEDLIAKLKKETETIKTEQVKGAKAQGEKTFQRMQKSKATAEPSRVQQTRRLSAKAKAESKVKMDRLWKEIQDLKKAGGGSLGVFGGEIGSKFVEYATEAIKYGFNSAKEFSAHMIERFGDEIKPHIDDLWESASGQITRDKKDDLEGKLRETVEGVDHEGKEIALEDVDEDDVHNLARYVRGYVSMLVDDGSAMTLEEAISGVKKVLPEFSHEDLNILFSGHGIDEVGQTAPAKVKLLRELKSQSELVAKLNEAVDGGYDPATGKRPEVSEMVRKLRRGLDQMLNEQGKVLTPAETQAADLARRMRDALDDIEYGPSDRVPRAGDDPTIYKMKRQLANVKRAVQEKWGDHAPAREKARITAIENRITEATQQFVGQYRNRFRAKQTPEEVKAAMKRLTDVQHKMAVADQISDLEEQLRTGNYKEPEVRPTMARTAAERRRDHLSATIRQKIKDQQPLTPGRIVSEFVRGNVLSSPTSGLNIGASVGSQYVVEPFSEFMRPVVAQTVGRVGGLGEQAGTAGRFSPRGEGKAISQLVRPSTYRDIITTLIGRGSEGYNKAVAEGIVIPRSKPRNWLAKMAINFHSALKVPSERAAFARETEKFMDLARKTGRDPESPKVQADAFASAWNEATHAKMMNDGLASDAMEHMLGEPVSWRGEKLSPTGYNTGKVADISRGLKRTIVPIAKVPVNLAGRTLESSPIGLEYAMARHLLTMTSGIVDSRAVILDAWKISPREGVRALIDASKSKMTPEASRAIMNAYARGLVGTAVFIYGANSGALDVDKHGHLLVNGQAMPTWLSHIPVVESLVMGIYYRNAKGGFSAKMLKSQEQAALDVITKSPFVSAPQEIASMFGEYYDTTDTRSQKLEKGGARYFTDIGIPQIIKQLAAHMDTDSEGNPVKRKPADAKDEFKLSLPGLREQVPKGPLENFDPVVKKEMVAVDSGYTGPKMVKGEDPEAFGRYKEYVDGIVQQELFKTIRSPDYRSLGDDAKAKAQLQSDAIRAADTRIGKPDGPFAAYRKRRAMIAEANRERAMSARGQSVVRRRKADKELARTSQ